MAINLEKILYISFEKDIHSLWNLEIHFDNGASCIIGPNKFGLVQSDFNQIVNEINGESDD